MRIDKCAAFASVLLIEHASGQTDGVTTLDEGFIGPSNSLGHTFKGSWSEQVETKVVNGNIYEKISIYMRMGVGKLGWSGGTFVQSYASFVNPEGGFNSVNSFTCSTEFNFGQDEAQTKIVESF